MTAPQLIPDTALTLHAVQAFAVLHAGKYIENRSWMPPESLIGQRLAIHAGTKAGSPDLQKRLRDTCDVHDWPRGIVGTVQLAGVVWTHRGRAVFRGALDMQVAEAALESEWYGGPFGWVLRDPCPLDAPIPCKGALGLWRVPALRGAA